MAILSKNKQAQIWVETVIYTLIGLVLIAMVLAVARPAIEKQKDQRLIELTIESMKFLDDQIDETKISGTGNVREVDFLIKKGQLVINGQEDKISFVIIDSSYAPSEVETNRIVNIPASNLKVQTQKLGKDYKVTIWREYSSSEINITYNNEDKEKIFNLAPNPYAIMIENKGRANEDSSLNINLYERS